MRKLAHLPFMKREMLRFELEVKCMRKDYQQLFRLFFMSFVLNSVTTLVCLAEERREDKSVEDIVSAYVLRNHEMSLISIMMTQQPSTTFNYQGFTASTWGSVDTKPYPVATLNNLSNYTQTDFLLAYFKKMGILQLGGGYVNYSIAPIFSGTPEPLDFQKIFVMFGLDMILSPTLTISKEINNYSQWSALLNISHTYEFSKNVSLKSSASAGYSKREEMIFVPNYDGRIVRMVDNDDSFCDGTIAISLPITVTKSLSIIPTVSYAFPFNNDSRHEFTGKGIVSPIDKSGSFVYGGLSISYSF
jgi:hypothetical protein